MKDYCILLVSKNKKYNYFKDLPIFSPIKLCNAWHWNANLFNTWAQH